MKILHVITSLSIGGAEKLIVDIVPMLIKRGHTVEVALLNGKDTAFRDELAKCGVNIHNIAINRSYINIFYIFKLRRLIRNFDIVHTHNVYSQYYTAFANLLLYKKTKLVTTEHSTHNRRRDINWIKSLDRFVYSLYNSIICISEKTRTNLINHLHRSKNIFTINNGINLELFDTALAADKSSMFGVEENVIIVTQVAGFRPAKDQDTLIRSLKYLDNNVHAVFVGDGERLSICERLAADLNVRERVHFLGLRSDIAQILKSSDVVVMSSHWDGFGLAAVEGMAAKKPTIASNIDGLMQVVEGAGVIFEVCNDEELAKKIKELIEDREYYNNVASKCYERSKLYDINKMVDDYAQIYLDVMNS